MRWLVAAWVAAAAAYLTALAARLLRARPPRERRHPERPGTAVAALVPSSRWQPTREQVSQFVAKLLAAGEPLRVTLDTNQDAEDPTLRGCLRTRVEGPLGAVMSLRSLTTDVQVVPLNAAPTSRNDAER